jgi:RNA-directed DNA polymerase
MRNGPGQSDGSIVPEKSPNNPQGAEGMEGRQPVKGNAQKDPSRRTQSRSEGMQMVLERIREAVRRDRKEKLTALYHHVYQEEHLTAAYYGLKREAAPGIDGETWQEYGEDLSRNLADLAGRLARGAYRAQAVRRKYIAKADGRQRPLGIPALEDKIVQKVVADMFSAIWEEEFLGFSYGFRPGRSAHQALDALAVGIERKRVGWVLDADLRGFFDTLSHAWLVKFIEHRIGDRRIVRLVQQWLKAGVMEEGQWRASEAGSPQGGLISPVLANLYLHYVFDQWVQQWRRQKGRGGVIVVRYADDFVVGFERQGEAQQFRQELTERLKKFELELHAEKTRLIEFGRNATRNRAKRGEGKPETFDFLGFTHYCSTTQTGYFVVKRQTMRKRVRAKLKLIQVGLKRRMHLAIPEQGKWLASILRGHYQYYGVPYNSRSIWGYYYAIQRLWQRSLMKRSQKGRVRWERMERLSRKWLPSPRICQPYPSQRLKLSGTT